MNDQVDEICRRRFEQARRSDAAARLDDYLPPPDSPSLLGTLEELVMIDMEFGWKRPADKSPTATTADAPAGPLVETYLARHPQLAERAIALRLLRHEYELRSDAGPAPSIEEYRRRFPQWVVTGREIIAGPATLDAAAVTARQDNKSDVVLADDSPSDPAGAAHLLINTAVSGESSGRYSLTRLHAEGGLGRIWVAHDGSLRRDVALKELKPRPAADAESWRRFLKEAQVTGQLEHPNIVPVYELNRAGDRQPFYTMRLVKGKTLRAAIAEYHARRRAKHDEPLDLPRLLQAFLGVCHAVSYAHSRGVVHRDLKPDNIILGDFGEVLVLDWGLAKTRDAPSEPIGGPAAPAASPDTTVVEGTIQGQIVGTPAYMAPEQAGGRIDEIDERTDVFGLGAVLYEILTGKPPRTGKQARAVIDDAVRRPIPAARSIEPTAPPALDAVCARALALAPGDRYPAASDLAAEVEHYLADEPTTAYREPLLQQAVRLVRKHRTKFAVGAAAAMLIGLSAIGGLFLWQEMQHRRDRDAAEHRRQLQAAEAERVRQAEAADIERRERIRAAALVGKELAQSNAKQDRFGAAADLLDKALEQVPDDPAVADIRPDLVKRRDLYRSMAEFYRLTYEAERLQFLEYDDRSEDACRAALLVIGAWTDGSWVDALPNETTVEDGLTKLQADKLREDVFRDFFLLAAIKSKPGLLSADATPFIPSFREAIEVVDRAEQLRRTQSGRILKSYLLLRISFLELLGANLGPQVEPADPADLYYVGLIHFWVGQVTGDGIAEAAKAIQPIVGLDFTDALGTSERMMREASSLDPRHYWTWFFYGWTRFAANDFVAAELVMNACVAIDPRQPLGYSYRGISLVRRAEQLTDPAAQASLRKRGLADCVRAVEMEPETVEVRWLLAQAEWAAGNKRRALDVMLQVVDMEEPLEAWQGRRVYVDKRSYLYFMRNAAAELNAANAKQPDVESLAAQAEANARLRNVVIEQDAAQQKAIREAALKTAGEATAAALKLDADHPRALCVRAALAADAGKLDDALRDYEAALTKSPNYWTAGFGKARTLAALEQWDRALAANDRLPAMATLDWQRIEAHLGRALALDRLSRKVESDAAFGAAVALDRRALDPRKP